MGFISLTHLQTALNKIKTIFDTKAELTDIPDKLPADGGNADTVNGHTVNANVPADAVFTDTTYKTVSQTEDGLMSAADKEKLDGVAEELNDHIADQVKHITAEERAAWNAVNYSNPNLLINPDFRINQRGKTEYTSSGYTVDRWSMTSGSMKVSINDAGNLVISRTASGGYPMFGQRTKQKIRAGEFYTYSIRYKSSSGLFKAGLAFINSSGETTSIKINRTGWFSTDGEWHTVSIKAEVPEGYTSGIYVYIHDLAGNAGTVDDAVELEYSKLEIGSIATPFCPPDPATELAKCQRYFYRLGGNNRPFKLYGIAYGSHSLRFSYNLPVEMRTTPTLTCSPGNWRFCVRKIPTDGTNYWNNEYGTTFAVDGLFSSPSNMEICVELDSSKTVNISEGDSVTLNTNTDLESDGSQKYPGWLDFDAEL